jgi:hypothetical protein
VYSVRVSGSLALRGGAARWLRVRATARRELASRDQSVAWLHASSLPGKERPMWAA